MTQSHLVTGRIRWTFKVINTNGRRIQTIAQYTFIIIVTVVTESQSATHITTYIVIGVVTQISINPLTHVTIFQRCKSTVNNFRPVKSHIIYLVVCAKCKRGCLHFYANCLTLSFRVNVTFIVVNPPDKHIGLLVNSIVDRRSTIIQNGMLTSKRIIHTIRGNFFVRCQIICFVAIQYRTLSSSWPITNTRTLGQILTAFKLFQLIASYLPHFIIRFTTHRIGSCSASIQRTWPEI